MDLVFVSNLSISKKRFSLSIQQDASPWQTKLLSCSFVRASLPIVAAKPEVTRFTPYDSDVYFGLFSLIHTFAETKILIQRGSILPPPSRLVVLPISFQIPNNKCCIHVEAGSYAYVHSDRVSDILTTSKFNYMRRLATLTCQGLSSGALGALISHHLSDTLRSVTPPIYRPLPHLLCLSTLLGCSTPNKQLFRTCIGMAASTYHGQLGLIPLMLSFNLLSLDNYSPGIRGFMVSKLCNHIFEPDKTHITRLGIGAVFGMITSLISVNRLEPSPLLGVITRQYNRLTQPSKKVTKPSHHRTPIDKRTATKPPPSFFHRFLGNYHNLSKEHFCVLLDTVIDKGLWVCEFIYQTPLRFPPYQPKTPLSADTKLT